MQPDGNNDHPLTGVALALRRRSLCIYADPLEHSLTNLFKKTSFAVSFKEMPNQPHQKPDIRRHVRSNVSEVPKSAKQGQTTPPKAQAFHRQLETSPSPNQTTASLRKTNDIRSKSQTFLQKHRQQADKAEELYEASKLFVHQPLQLDTASVRLVEILSPRADGMIRCTIRHAILPNPGPAYGTDTSYMSTQGEYTCLSYIWGSARGSGWIMLNDRPSKVGKNLWDFLHATPSMTLREATRQGDIYNLAIDG
jgi:hypothetical protein